MTLCTDECCEKRERKRVEKEENRVKERKKETKGLTPVYPFH